MRVLSLGAGVQSTTVLLMSLHGELPPIDHAVFADTQWEPKPVYDHLRWLKAYSEERGVPVHIVTAGNLRTDAIEFRQQRVSSDGKRWASMPLFVKNPDGSVGMIRRQCTKEFKILPVERFIRQSLLGVKPGKRVRKGIVVEQWFGISFDEPERMRTPRTQWQKFHYPLIYDCVSPRVSSLGFEQGYDRHDCITWMLKNGFKRPPRSACNGCPFRSDDEWIEMRDNSPDDFADAVDFDIQIRKRGRFKNQKKDLIGLPYVHRSCVPLGEVEFVSGPNQWANECSGYCGV